LTLRFNDIVGGKVYLNSGDNFVGNLGEIVENNE